MAPINISSAKNAHAVIWQSLGVTEVLSIRR